MANEELTRLATLAAQFNSAADEAMTNDPATLEKIRNSVTEEEMEEAQNVGMDVATESLGAAFGGEPSEKLLKGTLKIADLNAQFLARALPAEKIAALVPAELKNAKDAEALTKAGAPKLASLCV